LAPVVTVQIVPADPAWPDRFAAIATDLRAVLGDRAERIDHIGSTSVPGLAAKDVIDIQLSVAELEPHEPVRAALVGLGWAFMADNPDRRKRFYLRRGDGFPDANLHVRRTGEFSQQAALLLRDHLRADAAALGRYEATKRALAERQWEDVDAYADAKGDCVWQLLREADRWAWTVGWSPGPSDA
jgi:GrpB-like predicted nucleotidyltransferase (UPF0157 family)